MRNNRLQRRRWLNRIGHHTTAFVMSTLHRDSGTDDKGNGWVEVSGQIVISDCRHQITLDFEDNTNSLYKLHRLIGELEIFQKALKSVMEE